MAKKDDRLIVYEKIYKLIFYSNNLLQKFPKYERFALCNEIRSSEMICLKDVMRAWKEPNASKRYDVLSDADICLYTLKTFTRMSYELKYITDKNYIAWDNQIDEIGKMLGAWRKKCQSV